MPLYEMSPTEFRPISTASFAVLQVRERDDLQRLLRTQIEVLGDDLYVLSEEFGDWDDSRRRIDGLFHTLEEGPSPQSQPQSGDGLVACATRDTGAPWFRVGLQSQIR